MHFAEEDKKKKEMWAKAIGSAYAFGTSGSKPKDEDEEEGECDSVAVGGREGGISEEAKTHLQESELTELSKATLGSYVKKASKEIGHLATNAMHLKKVAQDHSDKSLSSKSAPESNFYNDKAAEYHGYSYDASKKQMKRAAGVAKATDRLMKETLASLDARMSSRINPVEDETELTELSKATLGSYIKKASHDVGTYSAATGRYSEKSRTDVKNKDHDQARRNNTASDIAFDKSWSRRAGIAKATDRLVKEEDIQEAE